VKGGAFTPTFRPVCSSGAGFPFPCDQAVGAVSKTTAAASVIDRIECDILVPHQSRMWPCGRFAIEAGLGRLLVSHGSAMVLLEHEPGF
jgi:hypothetical protein